MTQKEKLKKQYSDDVNAISFEINKILVDFKHELELEHEKYVHLDKLLHTLVAAEQFERVNGYIGHLYEVKDVHLKTYQRFAKTQKQLLDKILEQYNEDAAKFGLYIAKYDELGNRINE